MKSTVLIAIAACLVTTFCARWDPTQLNAMAASAQQIQTWAQQGRPKICAMRDTDKGAGYRLGDTRNPPSAWSIWEFKLQLRPIPILSQWGWHEVPLLAPNIADPRLRWAPFLQFLGGDMFSAWEGHRWVHRDPTSNAPIQAQTYRTFTVGSSVYIRKTRSATGAHIEVWLSPARGTILITSFLTTEQGARQNWHLPGWNPQTNPVPIGDLPHLHLLSDIIYSPWAKMADNLRWDLAPRYIGFAGLGQPNIIAIVARMLLDRGLPDLEPFPAPRSHIHIDTDEGRALMSTVIGKIVALFLIQHKNQIGWKQVSNFIVYRGADTGPNGYLPNIIIEIADVPVHQRNTQDATPPNPYPAPALPAKREEGMTTMRKEMRVEQGSRNFLRQHIVTF